MTKEQQEFLEAYKRATPDSQSMAVKILTMGTSSPGFIQAVKEATPPGEEMPPLDVLKALVDEWAEREGLN